MRCVFLSTLLLFSIILPKAFAFDFQGRNGLPFFTTGKREQTPLMAIIQDPRFARGDKGFFEIRSASDRDIWRNYTVRKFTPPYRIQTSMRMSDPSAPGAGVLFCLSGKGNLLVGLNKTGAQRFRMEESYQKGNWKLNEWVPVEILVEKNRIQITHGDETLSYKPKGPIVKGHIGIDVYCATGAWKPIRITDPAERILFEEKWDGKGSDQWFSPGKNMMTFFKSCGVGVYQVNLELKRSLRPDGSYDFSSFDASCQDILAVCPKAFIIARTWVDSGKAVRQETIAPNGKDKRRFSWSYSDPIELQRQQNFLKTFLAHAEKQSYGKSLAGMLLMSGHGGEFVYHFDPYRFSDYSVVQQRQFQKYLKDRYQTIEKLNARWKSGWKEFSAIPIPSYTECEMGKDHPLLLSDEKDRHLIDYQIFHNENIVRWINALACTIKKNSRLPRLVGVYYGYTAVATGSVFNKGHNALAKLLETDVDFISCPYQYRNRTAGNPIIFQSPFRSATLHGKQIFLEDDSRTSFCSNQSDPFREKNLKDSQETLKRNFLQAFSNNGGLWYLDFGANWFAHPELKDVIAKISTCYQSRAKGKFLPAPKHAVALISEQAFCRMRRSRKAVFEPIFRQIVDVLGKSGVQFDVALLSDLGNLPPYSFYFVPNLPAAPRKEREMVEHLRNRIGDRLFAPTDLQCVPLSTIREKLKQAGIEPISESPIAVYQGSQWLGIHTLEAEDNLTIRFPKQVTEVEEFFTGEKSKLENHQLVIPVEKGKTYLWFWK